MTKQFNVIKRTVYWYQMSHIVAERGTVSDLSFSFSCGTKLKVFMFY